MARDVAVRALELAACQTAQWKKKVETQDGKHTDEGEEERRRAGGRSQARRSFRSVFGTAPHSPSSSSHHPLVMVQGAGRVHGALGSSQQIAQTLET